MQKTSTIALASVGALCLGTSQLSFVSTPAGAGAVSAPKVAGATGFLQRAEQQQVSSSPLAAACGAAGVLAAAASLARPGKAPKQEKRYVAVAAFESELGVQAPVGFWDPAGFTADGSMENFARRRQTELKHGRVSMLATMGYITPEITGKLPGYLSPSGGLKFADVPNGLGAISKVPNAGWAQIAAYCAFCELSQDQSAGTAASAGDFGWKLLTSSDAAEKQKKLAAEIANGRLAMMAIIGMFFQDGLTGSAWGDWSLYTASPLRAFEGELGVQAPVGFWDPAGLAKDGNAENFKRRRESEIKHGRISMLATMGYITPELTGKFPGYLSPSKELAFNDIPNGLAAISKVPFFGWLQIVIYCLYCEASGNGYGYNQNDTANSRAPGDKGFKPPLLTSPDAEKTKKRLNAEIANGRLAMMAIIGMFFQDGLTGSAWGDWALYTSSPLRAFENDLGVQRH